MIKHISTMYYKNFLFISFVLFFSCSSSIKEEKEYYENGNIESVVKTKNRLKDGTAYYYYEDGTLNYEIEFKDGERFGYSTQYYGNGKRGIHGFYIGDLEFGWFSIYDSLSGILQQEIEFLIVPPRFNYFIDRIDTSNIANKVNFENQKILYKQDGSIDTLNSHFFTLNGIKGNSNEKNIFNKGEIVSFELKLETPVFEKSRMELFIYDGYPVDLMRLETKGYTSYFSIEIDKDIYYLEGIITEVNLENEKEWKCYFIYQPIIGK